MRKCFESDLEHLEETAAKIAPLLPENGVVFLRGDLAAGKTTLVKALAKAKGCADEVTSPTFSIQQIYDGGVAHYDLYQCPNEKFVEMGLLESLEAPGWHLIEWGDEALENFLKAHGFETAVVTIVPTFSGRRYEVTTDA
ncbi:tRNA (adenosine(37)-N6)-threonylcarbamoyltransferase complex ATPase subunit type 1 TsaE [Hydrogenimonas sp. SS33]|uniref:tRNA (adenosine(37)-N6)-threonylcarbamoyltransferase complex ATPase subunit type 1 TsaE n=1 Tax=Hydrogenimonas leucolamina TaxID=2954236 RepID=UPI00336C200F